MCKGCGAGCALKYCPEVDVLQSEKDGDLENKRRILEQVCTEVGATVVR